MGQHTNIEWCDSTINPTSGCDGCELFQAGKQATATCYASHLHTRRLARSFPDKYAADFSEVRMLAGRMEQAANWSDLRGTKRLGKIAVKEGENGRAPKPWLDGLPRMIFVGDLGDFLSRDVHDGYILREIFGNICSEAGRRHFWLLLTKRPRRLAEISRKLSNGLPHNCMAMTTVTSQRVFQRIEELNDVRCQWRGLSLEPLWGPLGLVDVEYGWPLLDSVGKPAIHWVIVGGESGQTGQRPPQPMHPAWVRTLRDQCTRNGAAFFFKQWGEWMPAAEAHNAGFVGSSVHHPWGECHPAMTKVGKQRAGRMLDGREWNEMPALL